MLSWKYLEAHNVSHYWVGFKGYWKTCTQIWIFWKQLYHIMIQLHQISFSSGPSLCPFSRPRFFPILYFKFALNIVLWDFPTCQVFMFSHFYILSLHICQVCSSASFARFACFACFACFALNIEVLGEAYQGIAGCHLILAFNTFAHKKQKKCQRETQTKILEAFAFLQDWKNPSIDYILSALHSQLLSQYNKYRCKIYEWLQFKAKQAPSSHEYAGEAIHNVLFVVRHVCLLRIAFGRRFHRITGVDK